METIWVFGDQLNRSIGALRDAQPITSRVLMIESDTKLASKPFHRQRLHLVLASMRRFAAELRGDGFEVDYRRAHTYAAGLRDHRADFSPTRVACTEPNSWNAMQFLERVDVDTVPSDQFLCHRTEFATWAAGRARLRMEDFYRWQRTRLGYLMDGDEPVGGKWNLDAMNREPPPRQARAWPEPVTDELTELDADVVASLPSSATGAAPTGWWATSRARALARLDHFVADVLPDFGPHQDAMLRDNWHLAHSLLSHALNIGLLLPDEVCDRVEAAYRDGSVPLNSAEGFIRQVIGWREYVWGIYWLWMPEYRDVNRLHAHSELAPVFTGAADTDMACVRTTLAELDARGWVHHIQRLMVLSNLAALSGMQPRAVSEWMWSRYVDGSEWVMVPNVIGMGLWADAGRMATKPYVSGGAYINRMSDYCRGCRFNPRHRTGEDACPFTSMYWDYLARNRTVLEHNPRMANVMRNLARLRDLEETRTRANEVRTRLFAGGL